MEFGYLRGILSELREDLGVLFEHGLAQGERLAPTLREHGTQLAGSGMQQGAELIQALCEELERARIDPQWTADSASACYARLWKYSGFCLRRLEFLEAEANLLAVSQ